jgi:hypothetical protein
MANAATRPPTSRDTPSSDPVTRIAAAAGVQTMLSTSRAPMICTDIATVRAW